MLGLREPSPATRALRQEAPADARDQAASGEAGPAPQEPAPPGGAAGAEADRVAIGSTAARPAEPGRAYEVRRNEAGEDVPVRTDREPAFARAPAPTPAPAPAAEGEGVRVAKPQRAEPMAGSRDDAAPAPKAAAKSEPSELQKTTSEELRRLKSQTVAPALDEKRSLTSGTSKESAALALDAAVSLDVCGIVRDRTGRPVAGADVTLAETGASVKTGADGRFCLRAPAGARTLSVLALGYLETRRTVSVSKDAGDLAFSLEPVSVLGTPAPPRVATGAPASPPTTYPYMEEPEDAFSVLPDGPRALARQAQREGALARDATRAGEATRAAGHWDASAAAWARLLPLVRGGSLELATGHELAVARFSAWESGPTRARALAAEEALRAYVQRAPAGPAKTQALEWLGRVTR
jgi:hypothetical protein